MLSACQRAVRNCPWTVKLWSQYLLAMERHHVEHQKVSGRTKRPARIRKGFPFPRPTGASQLGSHTMLQSCLCDFLQAVDFLGDAGWFCLFVFLTRSNSACSPGLVLGRETVLLSPSVFEGSSCLRLSIQDWSKTGRT